jgi:hypothetical protein
MKRLKSTTRQRGIALMMTLGVLALLLIMALAFAYTTRTERLAASVNTDLIRARLLAESGVERAIAFLREQYPGNPAPGAGFFVPTTALSSPPWVFDSTVSPPAPPGRGGRYLGSVSSVTCGVDTEVVANSIEYALGSTIGVGSTSYQFTPSSTLHTAVGWIPIKVTHAAGVESCVGLVGYLVIDETGKIDPTQAVGSIHGTASEATSNPDTRLGLDLREIAMADACAEDGTWTPPFSYGTLVGDLFNTAMPSPGRWQSIYHIMNAFSGLGANQAWLNRFTWSLRPFSIDEPEAYAATPGGTLLHRCDINDIDNTNPSNDNDWDTVDVENAGTLFPTGSAPADQPYPAGQPVGATGVGLPWIDQIVPAAPDPAFHKQVLANVIDFLDADVSAGATPTDTENDYVAATNLATYVGLEDVPYANEIFVRAAYVEPWPSVPLPPMISFEVRIDIDADVELINIYDTPRTVGRVDLDLEVDCVLRVGALSETQTVHIPYRWDGVAVGAHSYELANTTWGAAPVRIAPLFSLAMAPGVGRVFITVKSAKVTLNKDGTAPGPSTLWDFAQMGASPQGSFDVGLPPKEASVDVNDPRCNTDAAQWTWNGFVPSSGATHAGGAITAGSPSLNTHCRTTALTAPFDADDPDPIDWSTAFIRNGPVVSFWELGAIHRAEPWRTLNLHSSTQAAADVGQYAYGDWPLLNQIKLTAATSAGRGLLNVWDIQPRVWKPLLQGLRLGSTYADPCGSGTEVTDNTALADATVYMAAAGAAPLWSSAGGAVHGRAAAVLYSRLTGIDAAGANDNTLDTLLGPRDTDGLQEEVIGKVVGLLNDRISYYTILVCAKAVQDIGPMPAGLTIAKCPRDWIEYETGPPAKYCRPMAEQKVMALVWRNVATGQFRIVSFEYLED